MQEIWKDIKGFEGMYQVSNLGRVRSVDRFDSIGRLQKGNIKAIRDNGKGYKVVQMYKDNKPKICYIHRLVATAFIDNPDNKPEVHHIDSDRSNNKLENLQWVTSKENNNFPEHIESMKKNPNWLKNSKSAMAKAREKAMVINSYRTKFIRGDVSLEFSSLAEGARQLGLDKGGCTRVANGKQKHTHGYKVEYI